MTRSTSKSDFYKPIRDKEKEEKAENAVEEEVVNELEELGYSDEEIRALGEYIQQFIVAYLQCHLTKLSPKNPYELIIKQHENEEIEQYLVFNTNLRN